MKIFFFIFISGFIIMSCKPKSSTEETQATLTNGDTTAYEAAIMKIHDETMAKMSEMNQLETRLRDIRMKASQSDLGSAAMPDGIDDMRKILKEADNGMFDWMEYYSAMRAKLQKELMLEFMKAELVKITKVKENIDIAIEKTKTWLAAHPSL